MIYNTHLKQRHFQFGCSTCGCERRPKSRAKIPVDDDVPGDPDDPDAVLAALGRPAVAPWVVGAEPATVAGVAVPRWSVGDGGTKASARRAPADSRAFTRETAPLTAPVMLPVMASATAAGASTPCLICTRRGVSECKKRDGGGSQIKSTHDARTRAYVRSHPDHEGPGARWRR